MEKLSEYLPILIILVSVILTLIGKSRKQGKVTQETTLPEQATGELNYDNNLPKSFSDLFQITAEEKPKMHTQHKPEIKQGKGVASLSPTPVIIEPEEEDNSPFSFEEDDDVVRAIIYSEIINRKEY